MRNANHQHRRNRVVTLLLLPLLAVVWLIGWSLVWAGGKKDGEQSKSNIKHRPDHLTLIPGTLDDEALQIAVE